VWSRFRVGFPEQVSFENRFLTTLARATYEDMNLNFNFRSNSGRLYSIVTGRDLNGDQSSRDRPVGIGRNTEVGPANWNLDMTLTKDYQLGGRDADDDDDDGDGGRAGGRGGRGGRGDGGFGGFGGQDPRVRFQARVRNLLNRSQPRAYGSVLTSPLFGLPTGYTGGRTVDLSMSIDF
jgi:hypothetical protein